MLATTNTIVRERKTSAIKYGRVVRECKFSRVCLSSSFVDYRNGFIATPWAVEYPNRFSAESCLSQLDNLSGEEIQRGHILARICGAFQRSIPEIGFIFFFPLFILLERFFVVWKGFLACVRCLFCWSLTYRCLFPSCVCVGIHIRCRWHTFRSTTPAFFPPFLSLFRYAEQMTLPMQLNNCLVK